MILRMNNSTLRRIRNEPNMITLNRLKSPVMARIRRAPGIYNYVNRSTLMKLVNANKHVRHPLTRKELNVNDIKMMWNPHVAATTIQRMLRGTLARRRVANAKRVATKKPRRKLF